MEDDREEEQLEAEAVVEAGEEVAHEYEELAVALEEDDTEAEQLEIAAGEEAVVATVAQPGYAHHDGWV